LLHSIHVFASTENSTAMKTLYVSLLSVAIIGQAGYFCYDYQVKKHQSELNDSFREQTAATLSQLKTKTDNAVLDVKTLKELYPTLVDKAVEISATQIEQLQNRVAQLQDRVEQLQDRVAQLQDRQTQTDKAIEQTRRQMDNQTNDVASAINALSLNSLSKQQDTELELTARKTARNEASYKAFKEKIRKHDAWLNDPDAH
jgi:chromosome segregation ATPase